MRLLTAIFALLFLSSSALAETFVFSLQSGPTSGNWLIDFTGDGTDPTVSFMLGVDANGGPYISGPDTILDPANFSEARLIVSVTAANGYYQSTTFSCSESDDHCSRGDVTQGGTFSDISQVLDVSFSETISGPYAFYGPVSISVEIPAGLDAFVVAVPEPSSWAMLLIGFAGIGFAGWRRARRRAGNRGSSVSPQREVWIS
jgi:PEP-CTERM motif